MFHSLIPVIQAAVDSRRIVTDIREIYARDRWFTFPKFQQTAAYCRRRLDQAGLSEAQLIQFPADGKTYFGTWRGGLAWDAKAATLTVLSPPSLAGTVLADYRKVPCSLTMWSAPTPKGGVEAQVIDVGAGTAARDYAGKNIKGNIVLANANSRAAKALAVQHGAVGILTDWNPNQKQNRDAVFWNNGFADAPGGWPLTSDCSRIFAFGITPNVGQQLRRLLASGESLRVRATVDSRIYSGTFPIVTALIPGTGKQEVLALGHAFEQGAKDNASGVACIMEATRVLAELIRAGKLPAPRRGIRTLVTNECFGTIGYIDRFPQRTANTVAAICLDEVGIDQKVAAQVQAIHVNPQSNANYLDALVAPLAEAIWRQPCFNPYLMQPYGSSDNLIAQSSIGIPAVWVGCYGSRISWHTTLDTPDRMSAAQLATATVYTAVYLYFLANAGVPEAYWLANLSTAAAKCRMQQEQSAAHGRLFAASPAKQRKILSGLAQRMEYLKLVHGKAIASVLRLTSTRGVKAAVAAHRQDLQGCCDALLAGMHPTSGKAPRAVVTGEMVSPFATKMPAAAYTVRVRPGFSGPITYDCIPINQREGHEDPRWDKPVNIALGWADGQRTVAQIVALAEQETSSPLPGLAEELLWLAQMPHGPLGNQRGVQ